MHCNVQKNTLREWYAANNYETNLTKENFAPLHKVVVDSSIKKETLVNEFNEFRICGLFPFNTDNVDYSKCIAKKEATQNYNATTTETNTN